MVNLEGMNRAESRLYRVQERVVASKRWGKMLRTVDFGKEIAPYAVVTVKLNGRLKQYNGWAFKDKIEVSKDYYRHATAKGLTRLLKHEMAHVVLLQNGLSDGHGPLYKSCCHVLGLTSVASKEARHNWKHTCTECGWWLKANERREKVTHICKGTLRTLVSKSEYSKLKRIAKIGAKTVNISMNIYGLMEVTRIESNLRLKGGD